jgi:hypothetical protein
VAATFINGKIAPPQRFADEDLFLLPTSDKSGLSIGNYVNLIDATGEKQSGKVQVMDLTDEGIVVRSVEEDIGESFENPIQGGQPEMVH